MSTGTGLGTYTVQQLLTSIRATLGSSNVDNLSNAQIISKLNTVWQFSLVQDFVHFCLTSTWTFMTQAGIDRYIFPQGNILNIIRQPILNNMVLNFYDDNQTFFTNYVGTLQNYLLEDVTTATSSFSLQLSKEIARGYKNALGVPVPSVIISGTGTDGVQQDLYDFGTGELTDGGTGTGTVDYVTGLVEVNFSTPIVGRLFATFDNSSWTRPTQCLFYDNVLTLRNIPDQPYKVVSEVQYIPAPFTDVTDTLPIPTLYSYLHYKTALLIAIEINDSARATFIQKLCDDAVEGVERITLRQSDNRRRSNQFYNPEGMVGMYPYPINPYGPSVGGSF